MSMFGTRGKFILVVGDEGAVLCEAHGRNVTRRLFATSPADADRIREVLESRPRRSVTLMIDVLDMALHRESLPSLAPWEIHLVLRRRIRQAFANCPYTGGLAVRRDNGERRYLLAGVAESKAMERWTRFLASLPNPVGTVVVLAIEATDILTRLTASLGEAASAWQVLITRERTGGFRQVVCRDGLIEFTRLTNSLDADAKPAVVAAAIEQEFAHTIDYMKRLGYSAGDGLDLVILCSGPEKAALEACGFDATGLLLLSPHAAAGLLGLGRCVTVDEAYADVVHALAHAVRPRPRLRLMSEVMARDARSANLRRRGYWLAAAVGAVGLVMVLVHSAALYGIRTDMAEHERQRRAAAQDLVVVESALAELPQPRRQKLAELRTWQALTGERIDAGAMMARLDGALDHEARLQAVDWRLALPERPRRRGRRADRGGYEPRRLEMRITLDLVAVDGDRRAAVALAERLGERLATVFDDYAVSVTRMPVPIRPNETLRIESGFEAAGRAPPAMTMELLIAGTGGEGSQ